MNRVDNEQETDRNGGHDDDTLMQRPPLRPMPGGITFQAGTTSELSFRAPEDSITETRFSEQRLGKTSEAISFYTEEMYRQMGRKVISTDPYYSLCKPPIVSSPQAIPSDDLTGKEVGEVFPRGKSLWVKTGDTDARQITNFIVCLRGKTVKMGLYGEQDECYDLRLESESQSVNYTINCRDYLGLQGKIEKDVRVMYVDSTSVQKASQFFRRYLAQLLEREMNCLAVRETVLFSGWYLEKNGKWRYLSQLDSNCESTRRLADLARIPMNDQYAADQFALHVLDWGEPHVMVPVFLHSFSGILYKLFQSAGCPIRHILDLCGPTGLGKTLLMRLLYCPFDVERRMANFQSTPKGIELFCEQNHDSIAVLDDLSSMQDAKGKALLERLIRQYCDGNGRMFSTNAGRDLGYTDMSFGLAISTETPLDGFRQSSQLRLVTVEIRSGSLRDLSIIKKALLSSQLSSSTGAHEEALQGSDAGSIWMYPDIWDVFLTRFIRYLEARWSQIVGFIASFEPPSLPSGILFRRFREAYHVLSATARIVLRYFVSMGTLQAEQEEAVFVSWTAVLQEIIRENEALGVESDPVKLFMEITIQGLAQKLFAVASSKNQYESNPAQYYGFWDREPSDHLILDPNRIFAWVEGQLSSAGNRFTAKPQELWKKLMSQGFSEGYGEKGRKTPRPLYPVSINGRSIRMLSLRRHKLQG